MANAAQYYQYTSTITLASGQNSDSGHVDVTGARAVSFSVSCNTSHQLTAASPQILMTDGKQVTVTPGALPGGTDSAAVNLNGAGVITGADLSTATTRVVFLRAAVTTTFGSERMWGCAAAWITLTKAATPGNAIYTVVTTVYY